MTSRAAIAADTNNTLIQGPEVVRPTENWVPVRKPDGDRGRHNALKVTAFFTLSCVEPRGLTAAELTALVGNHSLKSRLSLWHSWGYINRKAVVVGGRLSFSCRLTPRGRDLLNAMLGVDAAYYSSVAAAGLVHVLSTLRSHGQGEAYLRGLSFLRAADAARLKAFGSRYLWLLGLAPAQDHSPDRAGGK